MARYEYRCPHGHVTEAIFPMGEAPAEIPCHTDAHMAQRVFNPPAAIHFKGSGFYTTDVKGRLNRRRRPNPGDDLPKEFDRDTAKIAQTI